MVAIASPQFSFVRFSTDDFDTCSDTRASFCLPVFQDDDIAFQFVAVADTPEEAAAMCQASDAPVRVGLVRDCTDYSPGWDLLFAETPERTRISELEVLFTWPHGFPNFTTEFNIGECFYVRVFLEHSTAGNITACSNCFERIPEDCFTSVLEYGGDENQFGFNYCGGGSIIGDVETETVCEEPTIVQFSEASALSIPYASMISKYGIVPTVQIWILEGGEYVQSTIRAGFDAYPPTTIIADLGGPATGFVKIS